MRRLAALVLAVAAGVMAGLAQAAGLDGQELDCLARNVYWEARSESAKHQQAIAHVTLNRLADRRFPDTICAVVLQKTKVKHARRPVCQFSWACDGLSDRPDDRRAWKAALANARHALAHRAADPTKGALFYHHVSVHPHWAVKKRRTVRIGSHVFYK